MQFGFRLILVPFGSGTSLAKLRLPHNDKRSWTGIIWWRIFTYFGGSIKRLHQAEALLWRGQVEAAIALFSNCHRKQAKNFCEYLRKHQQRKRQLRVFSG